MANAKISALPAAATPLAGTEVLPIVQSGVTDKVSVANLTLGRTVDTGNLIVTGTANVSGNFVVATNKFAIIASTGDTATAGTFDCDDDFSVSTNKFNVAAATGDTTAAGTFGVTGLTTLTGGLAGGIQSLSGPGAVNITTLTTNFTSTATGNALTLANGSTGQVKTVIYIAEAAGGDTGVLTPTNRLGYASITFNAIGDTATLQYTGAAWAILAVNGATITP
jgi:hypothetical protein